MAVFRQSLLKHLNGSKYRQMLTVKCRHILEMEKEQRSVLNKHLIKLNSLIMFIIVRVFCYIQRHVDS